ncbi:hypothetical protein HBB16_21675 [Pseudonocardia sp. MCCB 268]|nr:hypothetical protein [Pseudonocardia cytotoxica]
MRAASRGRVPVLLDEARSAWPPRSPRRWPRTLPGRRLLRRKRLGRARPVPGARAAEVELAPHMVAWGRFEQDMADAFAFPDARRAWPGGPN